jgi:hypothetical protein
MWFGPLFMIGLLVLIGALIVAVVRSIDRNTRLRPHSSRDPR